jgi:hypothetical protein
VLLKVKLVELEHLLKKVKKIFSLFQFVVGDLVVVQALTWQKLKQKNRSSLLEFRSKSKEVLAGPLTLVNHDCESPYAFISKEKQKQKAENQKTTMKIMGS